MIATSIATWITSFYIISNNETKEMIHDWKLKRIFETKAKMNEYSNEYLEKAKSNIDIVAIGMSNFLSLKRELLEKKLSQNVQIRIISCDNIEMLKQREKDETIDGNGKVSGKMKNEVEELTQWVNKASKIGKVEIKYHSTYPGFTYLRIDDSIFFGPNLPLYKSQLNLAFEFYIKGEGGKKLNEYFENLWNNENMCSDELIWKEDET